MPNTNTSTGYKCTCCSKQYNSQKGNFYKSYSQLYKGNDSYLVVCINCIVDIYNSLIQDNDNVDYVISCICKMFDSYFDLDLIESVREQAKAKNSSLIKIYFQKINSLQQYKFLTNKDSLIKDDSALGETFSLDESVEITEADKTSKNDCIKLLGYDPFAGYSRFDQKFLYGELVPYLDEDTLEDQFKLSQIIQILNNNNQIRKIDLAITKISSNPQLITNRSGDLKIMSEIKYKIVNNNDKIAKENSISVKNRGDKRAGKSTLTYTMKNLRELGFENAEQDYYDQLKANGMKRTADISHKSMLDQLQFDENDLSSMLKEQREILVNLQDRYDELEEENRQLHVQLGGGGVLDYNTNTT